MGRRRHLYFLLMIGTLALSVSAAPRPGDSVENSPQVAAATAQAIAAMRDEISRASITRRVTVGEFLRRTGAEDELTHALERAELVGGPRWIDKDTCQVQLDMNGGRIVHILQQVQANKPKDSPVTAADLTQLAEAWRDRTFSGAGSSTAFGRAEKIRPVGTDPGWAAVSEADRQKALAIAKADAIENVIASIKPIRLSNEKTVGDALANREVRAAVVDWLDNRPVTRIEYRQNLHVQLTMAGTPGGCLDVLRTAIVKYTDLSSPSDEAGWRGCAMSSRKPCLLPVGRAVATATTAPAATVNVRVSLPQVVPEWVDRKLEVAASVEAAESQLKAAGEARAAARKKLADTVAALPLTRRLTVGQAAEQDDRIRAAVLRALDKAEAKTDYTQRKGVDVVLRLDLHDLWDALRASQ